ncbi:uncharacterized protein LOC131153556 [Malania oleifera]|uniref:uncharacterized protein LOC131153556 n=1 Tax=Malania oleifera TaxID=397392 RepID=UPI0025AE8221|nr:uncharacterized protein LOC131153556 [Malania oleifera]
MSPDILMQAAILLLTLGMLFALYSLPRKALSKLRTRGRSSLQANRHFLNGAQLLARARSARSRSASLAIAKDAVGEADKALSLEPRDAAAHILKALALDLLDRKPAALRSLDAALSPPAVRSLSDRERGDALFKRAELQVEMNRGRRRAEAALSDLTEAVRLSPDNAKAWCILGRCRELMGSRDEARKAFEEAVRIEPGSVAAREGLNRSVS